MDTTVVPLKCNVDLYWLHDYERHSKTATKCLAFIGINTKGETAIAYPDNPLVSTSPVIVDPTVVFSHDGQLLGVTPAPYRLTKQHRNLSVQDATNSLCATASAA